MNIAVFGATGGIGAHLLQQGLEQGHTITAIVRKPEAITLRHERLVIQQGDVGDKESVMRAVTGQDAVLSTVGVRHRNPTTVYSEAASHIVAAMQGASNRRLLVVSASALDAGMGIPLWEALLMMVLQRVFRHMYNDLVTMEGIVQRSTLDWTILRPPRLTDGPRTGKYHVALNQHAPHMSISRADVADYVLRHLTDSATYRTRVEMGY